MGEGNAKTKSYSLKHRGYKKRGLITGINHRVIWKVVGLIGCRLGVCRVVWVADYGGICRVNHRVI